jgi:LPS-assembly lipoprotein
MSSSRRSLLAALGAGVLAGCGFQLRRPPAMPFRTIALVGFEARSPLMLELRRNLAAVATVVDAPKDAEVVVHALGDSRERGVVATTTAGQVRELEVRVRFRFQAATPGGRELIAPVELLQWRDLQYNETQALAKEQEAAEVERALQSDIVGQTLRRLAAITL